MRSSKLPYWVLFCMTAKWISENTNQLGKELIDIFKPTNHHDRISSISKLFLGYCCVMSFAVWSIASSECFVMSSELRPPPHLWCKIEQKSIGYSGHRWQRACRLPAAQNTSEMFATCGHKQHQQIYSQVSKIILQICGWLFGPIPRHEDDTQCPTPWNMRRHHLR